jgi:hypothetical protein
MPSVLPMIVREPLLCGAGTRIATRSSDTNGLMVTTPTTTNCTRDFDRYTDLLTGLPAVAAGDQKRLEALLDEIETWIADEESTCYHVAVLVGRVTQPFAVEAKKHTQHGTRLVTRLLPSEETYDRRLGVGSPVVAIEVSSKEAFVKTKQGGEEELRHRHEQKCMVFRMLE